MQITLDLSSRTRRDPLYQSLKICPPKKQSLSLSYPSQPKNSLKRLSLQKTRLSLKKILNKKRQLEINSLSGNTLEWINRKREIQRLTLPNPSMTLSQHHLRSKRKLLRLTSLSPKSQRLKRRCLLVRSNSSGKKPVKWLRMLKICKGEKKNSEPLNTKSNFNKKRKEEQKNGGSKTKVKSGDLSLTSKDLIRMALTDSDMTAIASTATDSIAKAMTKMATRGSRLKHTSVSKRS